MRRVSIQKAFISEDRSRVSLSRAYEGWEEKKPTVGEPYRIFCDSGVMIKTSEVVKVDGDFFETMNSIYQLTVLEEEPFDLGSGYEKSPKKTQEIRTGGRNEKN